MRARVLLACGVALVALAGAAPAPPASDERYAIAPTESGYLRIDKQSGEIASCRAKDAAWACDTLDDRKKLEAEVARLAKENKELQGVVKRLEELIGLPNPNPPASQKPGFGKMMSAFLGQLRQKWKQAEERRQAQQEERRKAMEEEERRIAAERREPPRETWRETRRDAPRETWQESRRDPPRATWQESRRDEDDRTFWNDRRAGSYDDERRGYRRDW